MPDESIEANEHKLVGSRLRDAREMLGLTQAEVAGALGLGRTSINQMELGRRKVTGLELRRLSRLYRRPVSWLLGEETPASSEEELTALFRATSTLTGDDKEQVLRFAEFLAGSAGNDRSYSSTRDDQ